MQARRLIRLVLLSALCVLARPAFAGEYVLFYHNDALGSPQAMTDINGNVVWRADYEPFGNLATITETLPNTHEFIGKERDQETSLSYFGARFYDGGIGRFLSVDPALRLKISFATLTRPQLLNNYVYGGNNPYRFVDRDGRAVSILVPMGVAIAANFFFPSTLETQTRLSALQFGIETGLLQASFGLGRLIEGVTGLLGKAASAEAKFFGENVTHLKTVKGTPLAREVGKDIEMVNSELPGGIEAAKDLFAQQVGRLPSKDIDSAVVGTRTFTFRPSGTPLGSGPPTVEVVDKATGTIEKIRFTE
jgi:RHS repeat-associated protein